MCGITGLASWWHSQHRNTDIVAAMTATLTHRGPDATGAWTADHIAFGHTRLAIIDRVGGAQPMTTRRPGAGTVALTFSGEVYNHRELRTLLQQTGAVFTGHSDTEVVLHAYLRWGSRLVDVLRGMYAFAVWDSDDDRLTLVRDRFGIKPLYYARTATDTVFASEVKALLAHPEINAEVDETGLAELVAMVPMASPGHAVLRGVVEVPPASIVQINRDGVRTRRYWALPHAQHPYDRPTTVATVRRLLHEAVTEQCHADVPIAALNSGGVDSAAIAALAAARLGQAGQQLSTFEILHTGGAAPASSAFHRSADHPYSLLVADHIRSAHTAVDVTAQNLLAARQATITAMDRPSLTTINASLWWLFKHISQHRRVVLSGEGSDELFAGYRWHNPQSGDGHREFPWARTYQPLSLLLNRETQRQLRPGRYIQEQYQTAVEKIPIVHAERAAARRYREIKTLTVGFYLPFLLRRTDRLSAAHGVEVRVPFLDHRLWEAAWNIPQEMLPSRGREKGILREAVANLLPAKVTWRPKSGYPASLTSDFQKALWEQARDLAADPTAPVNRLIDRAELAILLDRSDGNLGDWTPLQLTSYVLELDAWLSSHRVRLC